MRSLAQRQRPVKDLAQNDRLAELVDAELGAEAQLRRS
jgi:hypothetical protein